MLEKSKTLLTEYIINNVKENHMIILAGPSASGKTATCLYLQEHYGIKKVVTHTTRSKREGEEEGVDYHFVDDDTFNNMVKNDEFIEHIHYNGNQYGTSKKEVKLDKPLEPIAEKVAEKEPKIETVTEPKEELKPTCPAIVVDSSKDEIQSVKLTQEQEKEVDNVVNDPVNHPSHYQGNGVECIDCIKSAVSGLDGFHGFCAGNAIKYIFRFSHKNGVEDLRKAEWYIDRLIKAIPGRHE